MMARSSAWQPQLFCRRAVGRHAPRCAEPAGRRPLQISLSRKVARHFHLQTHPITSLSRIRLTIVTQHRRTMENPTHSEPLAPPPPPPAALKFDVSPCVKRKSLGDITGGVRNRGGAASSATPTLELAQFQEALWLDFGRTPVNGAPKTVAFDLRCPADATRPITVSVDKVPTRKGFTIMLLPSAAAGESGGGTGTGTGTGNEPAVFVDDAAKFAVVPPGRKCCGRATWAPTEAGGVSETALLKYDGRYV